MSDFSTVVSVLVGAGVYHVAKHGLPAITWPVRHRTPAARPAGPTSLPAPPGGPPPGPGDEPLALPQIIDFDQDMATARAFNELSERMVNNGTVFDEEAWPR